MLQKQQHKVIHTWNGVISMQKYKVIKTYTSTDGTLYINEIVKRDGNQTLQNHVRVRDTMGRIWFIPEDYLKKA